MNVTPIRAKAGLKLEPVLPEDLAGVWDHILRDIAVVAKRSGGTWRPEHVFATIYSRAAELYLAYVGTTYAGLVVVNQLLDPFTGERALGVWICYSRIRGALDEGFAQLEGLARSLGCKSIKMQSPRKGWQRRLARYGFKVRDYVMEKQLVTNG